MNDQKSDIVRPKYRGGWVGVPRPRPNNELSFGTSLIACIVEEDCPHVGKLLDLTSDLISQARVLRD